MRLKPSNEPEKQLSDDEQFEPLLDEQEWLDDEDFIQDFERIDDSEQELIEQSLEDIERLASPIDEKTPKTPAKIPFPGQKVSKERNESLLSQVLQGRPHTEQVKIIQIAYNNKLDKDDPLWSVMLELGIIEQLLIEKPERINTLFEEWRSVWKSDLEEANSVFEAERRRLRAFVRGMDKYLEQQTKAALDVQSQNISDTTTTLIRKAAFDKVGYNLAALIWAGSYLFLAIAVGMVIGVTTAQFASSPKLDPNGPRQLTLDEAAALAWANSDVGKQARANPQLLQWAFSREGKWAKEFMRWNETLLVVKERQRLCEKDARNLGVTLTLDGRVAKSKFCTLWVAPPDEREFVK